MGSNSTGCTEWERDFDPATEQPRVMKMTTSAAKFERQRFGALVATIVETDHVALEVLVRNDGKFVLTVHNRTGEPDRWEDLSVTLEPKHFEMLGSVPEKCSEVSDVFGPRVGQPTEKPIKGIDTDEGGF